MQARDSGPRRELRAGGAAVEGCSYRRGPHREAVAAVALGRSSWQARHHWSPGTEGMVSKAAADMAPDVVGNDEHCPNSTLRAGGEAKAGENMAYELVAMCIPLWTSIALMINE